jgi:serine/threonine protein kinase
MTGNIGTVQYMSPESIAGKKCKTKSDVYSFAIIMYELFFEKSPFNMAEYNQENNSDQSSGLNVFTLANRVLNDGLRPEMPTDESMYSENEKSYLELMRKSWAPNPDDRPDFSAIFDVLTSMTE